MASSPQPTCHPMARKRTRLDIEVDSSHLHPPSHTATSFHPSADFTSQFVDLPPSQLDHQFASCSGLPSGREKLPRRDLEEEVCFVSSRQLSVAESTEEVVVSQIAEAADSQSGSCLASYESSSTDFSSCAVDTLDELFNVLHRSQQHVMCTGESAQVAESCCGDDAQVDINSFLENWEEDVGALFSNMSDFYGDERACEIPTNLVGCSETGSERCGEVWRDGGEGDWFFGDLQECDGQGFYETSDQEWMNTAVASLDRLTETFEGEASMLHLLEASAGM